jgi:hypothetical protein
LLVVAVDALEHNLNSTAKPSGGGGGALSDGGGDINMGFFRGLGGERSAVSA